MNTLIPDLITLINNIKLETCITPQELIFCQENKFVELPKVPTRGMVGCMTADRVEFLWSLFVVISYCKQTNMVSYIQPRIRINTTGDVELGQEPETIFYVGSCSCVYDDFEDSIYRCETCHVNYKNYEDSFVVNTSNNPYKIRVKELKTNSTFVYFEFVNKRDLTGFSPREFIQQNPNTT